MAQTAKTEEKPFDFDGLIEEVSDVVKVGESTVVAVMGLIDAIRKLDPSDKIKSFLGLAEENVPTIAEAVKAGTVAENEDNEDDEDGEGEGEAGAEGEDSSANPPTLSQHSGPPLSPSPGQKT